MNLCGGQVNKQSMMRSSTGGSWKSSATSGGGGDGGVPHQFPAGLRVIVVDDDSTCLMILEKMLRHCNYEVTTCNRAKVALSLLRENKNGFDVVISEVHMPDMDGFKLLEHIQLEMDLPVIMMSADSSKSAVMKGVTHGACDYLIKPVCIEALRNIWQHVVRKRKHEWKDFDPSTNDDEPRVIWSIELHQQFVAAVNQLGIDKALPKKILELMNVPGLTRENVASHLQKYRLYIRRLSASLHPGGMNTGFMGGPDAVYGSMEPKQFVSLHQSGQHSLGSMNNLVLIQMGGRGQSQSQSQIHIQGQAQLNTNAHHGLRQPVMSNERQPVVSNEMLTCGGDGIIDTKVLRKGTVPKYDIFNDLKQNRDWGLQDVRLTFDQSQQTIQTRTDASSPLLLQHNRSAGCDLEGQNHMGARAGVAGVAAVAAVVVIVILIIMIKFPKLLLIVTT